MKTMANQVAQPTADQPGCSQPAVKGQSDETSAFDVVINANMVHLVQHPVRMLDQIERILAPGGHLFIADLRRSWMGLLDSEIKSALSMGEARDLFSQSRLREGTFRWSFLWWRFEA